MKIPIGHQALFVRIVLCETDIIIAREHLGKQVTITGHSGYSLSGKPFEYLASFDYCQCPFCQYDRTHTDYSWQFFEGELIPLDPPVLIEFSEKEVRETFNA